MDELDREVARLEAAEHRRENAWRRVEAAIDRGILAGTYAGRWLSDDGGWLVVAVTTDRDDAAARLHRADADAPVRIVSHPCTLDALKALKDRVSDAGGQLGAPLAYTGLDVRANLVEVALEDLNHPVSHELRARFAGAPIRWIRDTVVAC